MVRPTDDAGDAGGVDRAGDVDGVGATASPAGGAPLDDSLEGLLGQVMRRVRSARDEQARWRLLLEAVVSMAADLTLEELLAHIVRIAADLVDARYVALGVLGSTGSKRLRAFITHGLSEAEAAAIGDLPGGHGLLGLLIDRPTPVRLHDLAEHAQSIGFPAHHPPMHSFLGVPIVSRDKAFGNLYLCEKRDGADFTEDDERVVVALAAAAGVAIENARLYEEAARRERWLSATARITAHLTSQISEEESLQFVCECARETAGADVAWIVTGPDVDRLQLRVVSGIEVDPIALEAVRLENTIAGTAISSGVPVVIDDISRDERASGFGVLPLADLGPVTMFPLHDAAPEGRTSTEGVLALAWRHENAETAEDVDAALPAAFAEQVALALRIGRGHRERQQLMVYEDRERIGRDLHDVVIQRLFSVGLSMQTVLRRVDDAALAQRIDNAVEEIDDTIRDIRRTIFELGPAAGSDDLIAEVQRVVERAAGSLKFRPSLSFEGPVRLGIPPRMNAELLAVLREALSNAARHARASQVDVLLRAGGTITLRISDNGTGVPADVAESGLANMRRRAAKLGGRCTIEAVEPHGTVVEFAVPLAAVAG